jgi:hypothetical protein
MGAPVPYVEYDEVEAACAECGRLFRSDEALAAHRAESHATAADPAPAQRRVACSVCRQTFGSTGALAAHNRRAHSG